MKHMLRRDDGFALPTILIASVIMLMVLMSSITAVSSITAGLNSQYYNQLAREAAESGLARAESCLRLTDYNPAWTDAKPLKPDTDCDGDHAGGLSEWVFSSGNIRTYFTVNRPTVGAAGSLNIIAIGKVELLRASDTSSVWRSYSVTVGKNSRYNDSPQIASGAGWKTAADTVYRGHNGYMLTGTGALYGWGSNEGYQVGDAALGLPNYVTTPVKMTFPAGVTKAKKVFSTGQGASIVCIIATNSTLGDQAYCRGSGGFGTPTWLRFSLPGSLTAVDMSVNGYSTDTACVLASDQQAYCVGNNEAGNLGDGVTSGAYVPLSVTAHKFRLDLANPAPEAGTPLPLTVKKVFTQDRNTCVIASDDRAYCAGDNDFGQLGQGTFTTDIFLGKSTPGRALVPGNPVITDITMPYHDGYDGLFFVTANKEVFMSGKNSQGTANDGAFTGSCPGNGNPFYNCYSTPRSISSQDFDKVISIGEQGQQHHSVCLIANVVVPLNSGLWCLGSNAYGQLGSGDCVGRPSYYGAANLTGQIASSPLMNKESKYQMNSMMIITTVGDVFAMGDNTYGKLGTNGPLQACNPTPTKVQLPAGVKAVALANSDEYTAFILGDNGRLYSMGRNHNGQLGDGTTTDRKVPVEVKIPRQETIF